MQSRKTGRVRRSAKTQTGAVRDAQAFLYDDPGAVLHFPFACLACGTEAPDVHSNSGPSACQQRRSFLRPLIGVLTLWLADGSIPAYTRLDTRLGWGIGESAEMSIVGQNLFDPHHPEFQSQSQSFVTTQAKRGVYGEIRWQF